MYNAIGFICSIVAVFCDGGLLRLADALLLNDNVRIVMLTVSDVIAFLESFAPPALAEEWDNVGLLLGRKDSTVSSIMTCLTLTPDVAAEAVESGVDLIVSHHPVLFRGTKKITDSSNEGRMLLQLLENRIAVYSPHTSFDSAAGGVNRQLCDRFGIQNVRPMLPLENDETVGGGRYGNLKNSVTLREFLATVSVAVNADYVEYCGDLDSVVANVGVACGAASDFLKDAVRLNCDTFVTGEARFHAALEARGQRLNMILLGHYSSERPAIESLVASLSLTFSEATVFASVREADPLAVFRI